jgi:hypothetical protein
VQCTGSDWSNCTDNARAICNGDFEVIQQSSDDATRNLLFACKKKSGY